MTKVYVNIITSDDFDNPYASYMVPDAEHVPVQGEKVNLVHPKNKIGPFTAEVKSVVWRADLATPEVTLVTSEDDNTISRLAVKKVWKRHRKIASEPRQDSPVDSTPTQYSSGDAE